MLQHFVATILLLTCSFIAGCISNDLPKSDASSSEKLLVITSFTDFANCRLTLLRNGTFTWEHFDTERLLWKKLITSNLEEGELLKIETQLYKYDSRFRWTKRTKVKDEYGEEVELKMFTVIKESNYFVYNFSELDSSTMAPDVIRTVLDKCDYINVLNMLGFTVK
ncbi:MAG: hypothetical protein GXY41_03730 [Phycisphaerae bacterium]|nr:hypothetical protein [Phycisphaerae bacterium]